MNFIEQEGEIAQVLGSLTNEFAFELSGNYLY